MMLRLLGIPGAAVVGMGFLIGNAGKDEMPHLFLQKYFEKVLFS